MRRRSGHRRTSSAIDACSAPRGWPTSRWLRKKLLRRNDLKRQPRAHLQFPPRCHRHGDRAELGRVDEPIGRTKIRFVKRVEGFGAELERSFLRDTKRARQGEIETLHARAVYGVATGVPIGKRRGRGKRCRIEPLVRCPRAGTEYRLASDIRANGVFPEHRTGIGRIAEY